jgi:hypothetical protein
MGTTRREFMRDVGISIAALLAMRCTSCQPTCYTPVPPTPSGRGSEWDRLRQPWLDLDLLARDAQDSERGQATLDRLKAEHRAALDALVSAGQIEPAVADEMQIAFEGAAWHIWRANAPMTCYVPSIGPEYWVQGASNLARQADVLTEMASAADLDPNTVAEAQAAIEQDIAYLSLPEEEQQAIIERVMAEAGTGGEYPALWELDLEVSPESAEAARLLVDLLLGRQNE